MGQTSGWLLIRDWNIWANLMELQDELTKKLKICQDEEIYFMYLLKILNFLLHTFEEKYQGQELNSFPLI